MSFLKYERWMEGYALRKWESTLNLCVHAHGHDVDPIMEASCNNNYFLHIISFGIGELILCNRGSDHMFFFDPISRASLSTCLLWINTPVQPLLWSFIEITPWYLKVITELHNFLWVLRQVLHSQWFRIFHGIWVIKPSRTPITKSSPHRDQTTLSNLLYLRVCTRSHHF